jgi:hypothetical protein
MPRTLDETFEFFERPRNLPLITPPWQLHDIFDYRRRRIDELLLGGAARR